MVVSSEAVWLSRGLVRAYADRKRAKNPNIMYTTHRPFVQKVKTNFVTTPGIKNSRELTPSG